MGVCFSCTTKGGDAGKNPLAWKPFPIPTLSHFYDAFDEILHRFESGSITVKFIIFRQLIENIFTPRVCVSRTMFCLYTLW